ncbi:astacin, partial [Ancylostoma duodenale]
SNVDGISGIFNKDRNGPKRHKRQLFKWHYATDPEEATDSKDLTVYYRFDDGIRQELKDTFNRATKLWEDGTCLTFQEKNDGCTKLAANSGILVMDDGACYTDSNIITRSHNISLGEYCYGASGMAHEIGHALGFPHSQNRRDRDRYIIISVDNIKVPIFTFAALSDIDQYKEQYEGMMSEDEEANYGVPYDLGSLMQ